MALKDWKEEKIKYGNYTDIIFTSKTKNFGISIRHNYNNPKLVTLTYFPPVGRGFTSRRKNITKSQALKFAKNYMEKH